MSNNVSIPNNLPVFVTFKDNEGNTFSLPVANINYLKSAIHEEQEVTMVHWTRNGKSFLRPTVMTLDVTKKTIENAFNNAISTYMKTVSSASINMIADLEKQLQF